jgi:hypothetical protein
MQRTTLSRLSGATLIAGGLLFALGNLLHPLDHSPASQAEPTWVIAHVTFLVGAMIMVLGLPAVYQRQAGRAGTLGLVGFVLVVLGTIGTVVPGGYFEAFVMPAIGEAGREAVEHGSGGTFSAILGLVYLLGSILFGTATYRAGVFPRPASGLIALSAAELFIVSPFATPLAGAAVIAGTVLWGIGFAWLGAAHVRMLGRDAAAAELKQSRIG